MMYLPQAMTGGFEPNKLSAQIAEDMEKIRRMGFNAVYLFDISRHPTMGTTHAQLWYPKHAPETMEPLSFDPRLQEEIEAAFAGLLGLAREKGLKVVMAVCYNLPAQWLWKNLDAAKRKSDGTLHYTVYYHECFRSEKVRWYTRGRLKQLLDRYARSHEFQDCLARFRIKGRDAYLDDDGQPIFVIHNDTVDRGFCYCETCRRSWCDDYLPRIYKDIRRFNAAHNTAYGSFSEVPLPVDRSNERLWHELSQFFTEGLMGWMEVVRSTIREYIPDALMSVVMKYPRSSWATEYPDWAKVSELCDVLFMDPYPMESGDTWNIGGYAFDFETYRSISLITGKPIMCQFQLSSSYSGYDMSTIRAPTAKEILQQFYVAIGRGTSGLVCWGFPPGIADDACPKRPLSEEEAIEAAARINREARQLFLASEDGKEVYGQIMLPYNYPSVIRGEESLRELFELYVFFSRMGLSANPTYADFMPLMAQHPHRYRAVVGFSCLRNIRKGAAGGMTDWIRDGGMLLCGSDSMMEDENGDASSLKPFNMQVVGSHETQEPAEGDLQIFQERPCIPKPGLYPRPEPSRSLKATVADVVGIWSASKTGAIVINQVGKGLVLRTGLTGEIKLSHPTVTGLLRAFAESLPKGPVRVIPTDASDLISCFRKGRDLMVYLVNNETRTTTVVVEVWPGYFGIKAAGQFSLIDALTQEEIASACAAHLGGAVRFQHKLPPLSSCALRICRRRNGGEPNGSQSS